MPARLMNPFTGTVAPVFAAALLLCAAAPRAAAEDFVYIVLEAEASKTVEAPMVIADRDGASGEKCIALPQGSGMEKGSATIEYVVPAAGRYQIWLRTIWLDGCGNSVKLQLGDRETCQVGNDGTYNSWHWVKSKTNVDRGWRLTAGAQTLSLLNNEDGIWVDQIFITSDPYYVPQDIELPAEADEAE